MGREDIGEKPEEGLKHFSSDVLLKNLAVFFADFRFEVRLTGKHFTLWKLNLYKAK
jgi:hypothetical protein